MAALCQALALLPFSTLQFLQLQLPLQTARLLLLLPLLQAALRAPSLLEHNLAKLAAGPLPFPSQAALRAPSRLEPLLAELPAGPVLSPSLASLRAPLLPL